MGAGTGPKGRNRRRGRRRRRRGLRDTRQLRLDQAAEDSDSGDGEDGDADGDGDGLAFGYEVEEWLHEHSGDESGSSNRAFAKGTIADTIGACMFCGTGAGSAPAVPTPVNVTTSLANDLVFLDTNEPLVLATPFLPWTAVAAAPPLPARVVLTFSHFRLMISKSFTQ